MSASGICLYYIYYVIVIISWALGTHKEASVLRNKTVQFVSEIVFFGISKQLRID